MATLADFDAQPAKSGRLLSPNNCYATWPLLISDIAAI